MGIWCIKRWIPLLPVLLLQSLQAQHRTQGIYLEQIPWTEAARYLTPDVTVVIPLGAGAKEHGPHLPLSTDKIQAEGYRDLIAAERPVVITPTVTYGFYPAFIKYPGSTTVSFATATDMVLQIIRYLADYGPKRFYIINIGVSTTPTLETAARILAREGILLGYSDYRRANLEAVEKLVSTHDFTGHADEMETSNILDFRPDLVDMQKAVNDSSMKGDLRPMAPLPLPGGAVNPSGINGYAASGTAAKGRIANRAFAKALIGEIDSISRCPLPVATDDSSTYTQLAGIYEDGNGNRLELSLQNHTLQFMWNARDTRTFFHLYRDGEDYYSCILGPLLFLRDEQGNVIKAWCSFRGQQYWLTKK